MSEQVKVRVTAYRENVVIEAIDPEKEFPGWFPLDSEKVGCTLVGTQKSLGVSKEALRILRGLPRCGDSIGSVMWWPVKSGGFAFGWLGGPRTILRGGSEGDRNFAVREGGYVLIPNDTSLDAQKYIRDTLGKTRPSLYHRWVPGYGDADGSEGKVCARCGVCAVWKGKKVVRWAPEWGGTWVKDLSARPIPDCSSEVE